jgi:hypothetical protein
MSILNHTNVPAIVGLTVLFLICIAVNAAHADDLRVSAEPRKSEILPGEPLVVDVRLRNDGEASAIVDLGYDRVGAFWFDIRAGNGQIVSTSQKLYGFGASRLGRLTLGPGEVRQVPLVMNRWCSTILAPGEYKVTLNWETAPAGGAQVKGHAAFDLRIARPDESKLELVLDQLKEDALDVGSPTRDLSVQMLLNSQASAAVRPLAKFLAGLPDRQKGSLGVQALDALGRIATIDSVRVLTDVALEGDGPSDDPLRMRAVAMIYKVYDDAADRADVRDACQAVMRLRPRPKQSDGPID